MKGINRHARGESFSGEQLAQSKDSILFKKRLFVDLK
jgi:hypothetical protein